MRIDLFRPGSPEAIEAAILAPRLCVVDGTCEAGETPCNCSADCGSPPAMETDCSDGMDLDCDGFTDCTDVDCCGEAVCPTDDNDADSYLACEDCDDGNGEVWQRPGEVTGLVIERGAQNRAIFHWNAPDEPGSSAIAYETLRAEDPSTFEANSVCLGVSDPTATTSVDATVPAPGTSLHYLVRAVNDCPMGIGPLGPGRSTTPCR